MDVVVKNGGYFEGKVSRNAPLPKTAHLQHKCSTNTRRGVHGPGLTWIKNGWGHFSGTK